MKLRIPRQWRKILLWLLVALGSFLVLEFTLLAPTSIQTVAMQKRDLKAQVYGNGTIEAKVVVAVSSKINGRIESLHADQGDNVNAGQLLAKLEDEDFRQQVAQAQASLKRAEAALGVERAGVQQAQANLELAEKKYQRIASLGERNFTSQQDVDEQDTAFKVAKKELERARATVDAGQRDEQASQANAAFTESRKKDMLILAPQDGIIISRDLEQGATAAPGLPIFHLADPTVVWVKANVDEARRSVLAEGQEAAIVLRSDPKTIYHGRVVRIGLESDRVTEEIEVDVVFDPPLDKFRVGEQAEVFISTASKKESPSLPAGAVIAKGKQRRVWLVDGGKLHLQEVSIGIEDRDGFVEVLSGIDGKTVVVLVPPEILMTFKEGMRVKVEE